LIPIKARPPDAARGGQAISPEDIMAPDLGTATKATPISAVLRGCGNLASFGVASIEAFLEFCAGRWVSPVKVKEPKASSVEKAPPTR
jgi:hypothetical protein